MTADISADPRFAQMRARDAGADGQFVYAVKTTGVFCRPSCKARPARPENIVFYDTATEAARAGYRPCKRCQPLRDCTADTVRMQHIAAYIRDHAEETRARPVFRRPIFSAPSPQRWVSAPRRIKPRIAWPRSNPACAPAMTCWGRHSKRDMGLPAAFTSRSMAGLA